MCVQFNAFGLVGNAEKALVGLAFKYEYVTGLHVQWQNQKQSIYEMVADCIKSDLLELVEKALAFLDSLPAEVKLEFVNRGIEPLPHQITKIMNSRGRSSIPVVLAL